MPIRSSSTRRAAGTSPSRRAGAFVRADAGSVIAGICPRIPQAGLGWRQGWVDAEAAAQEAIDAVLSEWEDTGLNEPGVQRLLGGAYEDGDRVLIASSMPIRDAEAFLGGGEAGVRFHANRGANGIDGLIATGSGIALASGDPVWIVLGDLALAHDLGGLARCGDGRDADPDRRRRQRRRGNLRLPPPGGAGRAIPIRRSVHDPGRLGRSSGSPASSGSPSSGSRTRPVWPGSEPSIG